MTGLGSVTYTNDMTRSTNKLLPVSGNTYPVKDALKNMGAQWLCERCSKRNCSCGARKTWFVVESKHAEALALVARSSGRPAAARKPANFSNFVPTEEQAALREFVFGSDRNLCCQAGAGAGKTTTSLWLVGMIADEAARSGRPCRIAFVAFGTKIKADIEEKAPAGIEVCTMNALGFRALKKAWNVREVDVDNNFLYTVFKARYGVEKVREEQDFFAAVKKLIDLGKGALAETTEDLEILAVDYQLDLNGALPRAVAMAHEIMSDQRADKTPRKSMDFTDQQWLAVVHNVAMPQYDVLVIDEAQDTNALQLEMLTRCVTENGRVIAVGDRRQAIYGFRGADSLAMDKIVAAFDMAELPLMTTFRCAKAIVREAQSIVPEYKAGPNNAEGVVRSIDIDNVLGQVRPGDFVLSRTTAPIVSACIKALAMGIPAAVVGRDIGKSLTSLAKKVRGVMAEKDSVACFVETLLAWRDREVAKLSKKLPIPESAIEGIQDRAACLVAFADVSDSVDEIFNRISAMCKEDGSTSRVDFSNTHQVKGMERDRVFLMRDTYLKMKKNKITGEWEEPKEEEYNLLYVAITRAKNELVYVRGKEA